MACMRCGMSGGARIHPKLPMSEQPQLTPTGIYDLLNRTSDEPYYGANSHKSAYIVGYRTEFEKVFTKADSREASAYAAMADPAGRLRMFQAASGRLPLDVGLALWGG